MSVSKPGDQTLLAGPGAGETMTDTESRRFHDRVRLDSVRDGRVAWLVMERGDAPANAFDVPMVEGMVEALDALPDSARCLVLRGEREFSVGADLAWVADFPRADRPDAIRRLAGVSNDFIQGHRALDIPTVAAVNGTAAGGGLGFALSCDVIAMHEDAVLDPAYARIGLTPDNSTPYFLARVLGPHRARDLLFDPRSVDATTAEEWGLASRVVTGGPDEFDEAVKAYAMSLARTPPSVQGTTKTLVDTAMTEPFDDHLDRQQTAVTRAAGSDVFAEGLEAFFEGRDPSWAAIE